MLHISTLYQPIQPINLNVTALTCTLTVLRIQEGSAQAYTAAGDKRARFLDTALAGDLLD
jgi:hypothetical protein